MRVNHRGIRYFFRGFLLVMLASSIAMALFVHRHADDLFQPPGGSLAQQEARQQKDGPLASGGSGSGKAGNASGWRGPGWRGEVKVTRQEGGGSEVTITPVDTGGGLRPLTSFQVYLRSPDGKQEQEITDRFTKNGTGGLQASLKGTAAGQWLLRIRLHRELSTLEFTERIEVKQ